MIEQKTKVKRSQRTINWLVAINQKSIYKINFTNLKDY